MPMKKDIDIDQDLYNARIHVNGYRVYRVTDKDVFVEIYQDRPSIKPEEFWRDYAYSGEADKWFSQLDPDTIQFSVNSGQYGIGSDVRAYGRLTNASEVMAQKVREGRELQKKVSKKVKTLEKKIDSLEDEIDELNRSSRHLDIRT